MRAAGPFAVLTKYLEAESYLSIGLSAVQPLIKGVVGSLNVNAGDGDYAVSFKETAVNERLGRFENMFSPLPSDLWAISVALTLSALNIRFHKLRSLAGRHTRDIRVCIEIRE